MRTLMMLASILCVGTGTFCIANASVPFISVAFVVGAVILIVGICELIVNRVTVMRSYETKSDVAIEGITSVILGIVFLSGQVTEDSAVTTLFALWIMIDGLKAFFVTEGFRVRLESTSNTLTKLLGTIMTIYGVYLFYNSRFLNAKLLTLVGISLFLLGLNRFRIALAIEYQKPSVLTGNREKLEEARRDEKVAMQKAKEGIRETKAARARIDKAREAIRKEEMMLQGTERRRRAKKG